MQILVLFQLLAVVWARFHWTGAVTDKSAVIVAGGYEGHSILVSRDASPVVVVQHTINESVARIVLSELTPLTRYSYTFSSGESGSFDTFPVVNKDHDLLLAFGSCSKVDSEAYLEIAALGVDVFVHMGDLHYSDIGVNEEARFDRAIHASLSAPMMKTLASSTPIAYIWDDHDYGANDATSASPSRLAAQSSYRRNVPHYPLVSKGAIYQAFTMGRVRVVLLDIRSESVASGQIMSREQMQWLLRELSTAPQYGVLVVVSSAAWIGAEVEGKDSWLGHLTDRREVSNYIAAHNLDNIALVAGDAHMLAFDDGTNSDYSTVPGHAGIPVLQAAPLGNLGSAKGGPFTHNCFGYRLHLNQQYATMKLNFNSTGHANVTWTAHRIGLAAPVFLHQATVPFVRAGPSTLPQRTCSIPLFPPWLTALVLLFALLVFLNTALPLLLRCATSWSQQTVRAGVCLPWFFPFCSLLYVAADLKFRALYLYKSVISCVIFEVVVLLAFLGLECRWRGSQRGADNVEEDGSVCAKTKRGGQLQYGALTGREL